MRTETKKFLNLLIIGVLIISCGNLTRLKLPGDNASKENKIWRTAFHSNSRHNAVSKDVEPPMQVLWHRKYKSVVTDQPLALENYLIFTVQNGNLAYIDAQTGEMIGDGRIAPGFEHAPTIDRNILYYGTSLGNETLVALNLESLDKVWKLSLPHIYTAPLVWRDRIYSGTKNGQLYCVNKINGEKLWHFNARASLFGIIAEENGILYFADIKGNLYSIDGLSGEKQWMSSLSPNIYCSPVISDEKIFIGSTSGKFYALDKFNGKVVWETGTGGSIYSSAAFKDGIIYFGNNDNKFFALDADSGKVLWQYKTGGIVNAAPLVGKNYVYFGSWDENLYILSRYSGEEISRIEFEGPIKTSPLIYNDRLYVNISNDGIYCIGTIIEPSG